MLLGAFRRGVIFNAGREKELIFPGFPVNPD